VGGCATSVHAQSPSAEDCSAGYEDDVMCGPEQTCVPQIAPATRRDPVLKQGYVFPPLVAQVGAVRPAAVVGRRRALRRLLRFGRRLVLGLGHLGGETRRG